MGTRARRKARTAASVVTLLMVVGSLLALPTFAGASSLSIDIDKTVYAGHDGGSGCPGSGDVEATNGSAVTYCFIVTNTGSERLVGAAVGDPALGITSNEMTLLSGDPELVEPGASVVWFFQTTVDGDLVNTATVGAFPEDPSGGPSGGNPVVASDSATVTEVEGVGGPSEPLEPAIAIDKTVYPGHNAGASCPGENQVTVEEGDDLTFCFRVTNTGETYLADVTIDDSVLGIDQDQMQLANGSLDLMAPGDTADLYYETTAGEIAYVNTASTTGTPTDEEGTEIPDVRPPTDRDDASVDVEGPSEELEPDITIHKTVYPGHDAGASCPGEESTTVNAGDDITYCFRVENTGNTYLADVTIDDSVLGIDQDQMQLADGDLDLMAPGDTADLYYETTAGEIGYTNVATTTGTPSTPEGEEIPDVQPPTDTDDASVDVVDGVVATIDIVKVVYEGHDFGTSCSVELDDDDPVEKPIGTAITYCFHVTNTGPTHLADVVVDDVTLGITDGDMVLLDGSPTLLAPDATVVWYYQTTLDMDLINVAETTGTPATPDGQVIPDVAKPVASDDAQVIEFEVGDEDLEVDIQIEKTVYKGHDAGSGCATARDSLFAPFGTEITYCFTVTNTGTVHLANVTVDDPTLGITNADMTLRSGNPGLLAPGATAVWYYETTLDADLRNVASTTGTPSEPDGTRIPAAPPTDSDDALVGQEEVLDEELPGTGIDADVIAWFGVLTLGVGALLLTGGRRRGGTVASLAASLRSTPRVWGDHSMVPSRLRATARKRRLRR